MSILAIDPGTEKSGWVLLREGRVVASGVDANLDVLSMIRGNDWSADCLAVEMVASYGMAVGKEVFRTVWWSGRFAEAWNGSAHTQGEALEVFRQEVKLHLCQSPRAKDANIRQALIDMYGPGKDAAIGKKASPGPLYGVSSHAWAALAVAVTVRTRLEQLSIRVAA